MTPPPSCIFRSERIGTVWFHHKLNSPVVECEHFQKAKVEATLDPEGVVDCFKPEGAISFAFLPEDVVSLTLIVVGTVEIPALLSS